MAFLSRFSNEPEPCREAEGLYPLTVRGTKGPSIDGAEQKRLWGRGRGDAAEGGEGENEVEVQEDVCGIAGLCRRLVVG